MTWLPDGEKKKIRSFAPPPLVKAHTKLPILATYPYLTAGYRNEDHCEIRIMGYAASIGNLEYRTAASRKATALQKGFHNTGLGSPGASSV